MSAQPYLIPPIRALAPGAKIKLPGSKSIALRQMAMSALAHGTTTITGIPACEDTDAMLVCIKKLGASVVTDTQSTRITGPIDMYTEVYLDAHMSGASTRLLIGIAALRYGTTHIDGHTSLRARTNAPLLDVLSICGCQVISENGHLPLSITGRMQPPAALTIDGSLSSQYITALLLCLPLCMAQNEQTICIKGELVSRPYIDITINELAKRGIQSQWLDDCTLVVKKSSYTCSDADIEGDATAATYFAALATLHCSKVELTNLGHTTHQGDYAFFNIMEQLGAEVVRHPTRTEITGPAQLNTLERVDMNAMPDAALTLIALAPLIPGQSEITGLSSLHHKECDRLECPAKEFEGIGIEVTTTQDSIKVQAIEPNAMRPHTLTTYHDHRIAMAFSLLGSASGTLTVDDKSVVNKTYPNYWQDLEAIRARP